MSIVKKKTEKIAVSRSINMSMLAVADEKTDKETDEEKYNRTLVPRSFQLGVIYVAKYPRFARYKYQYLNTEIGMQYDTQQSIFKIVSRNKQVCIVLFFNDSSQPVMDVRVSILDIDDPIFRQDKSCYEKIEIPSSVLPQSMQDPNQF